MAPDLRSDCRRLVRTRAVSDRRADSARTVGVVAQALGARHSSAGGCMPDTLNWQAGVAVLALTFGDHETAMPFLGIAR